MRVGAAALGVAMIVLLAYLHLLTGLAYEFHLIFILPVAIVAWFSGLRAGYLASVFAAIMWFWSDHLLGSDRADPLPLIVNSGGRCLVFFAIVFLLTYLRSTLEREHRLASEDVLTRLPNRREFHEQGDQALALAQRTGLPVTAIFIDLDKFKQVNDTAGHQVGDELLVCVAEVLRGHLRGSDISCRLGGDEFALLLPGLSGQAAATYAEHLRRRLLQAMVENNWPVTFSIGVASYTRAPTDLEAILAAADTLMYEVKQGGRNRVLQKEMPSAKATMY